MNSPQWKSLIITQTKTPNSFLNSLSDFPFLRTTSCNEPEEDSPMRQVFPVHWGGQAHLKPLTRSWQVPPWLQGFTRHSSTSEMGIEKKSSADEVPLELQTAEGFNRSYWWSRQVQSTRGHSDTQNRDWFPHRSLHSNRGWTDRRGPLWRQRCFMMAQWWFDSSTPPRFTVSYTCKFLESSYDRFHFSPNLRIHVWTVDQVALTSLAVDSRKPFRTGAVVFVRSSVAAGSSVKTWLPCPTRVQV